MAIEQFLMRCEPLERKLYTETQLNDVGCSDRVVSKTDFLLYDNTKRRLRTIHSDSTCIFISKDGDDLNIGTEASPVLTMNKAISLAYSSSPKKTVCILDSETYEVTIVDIAKWNSKTEYLVIQSSAYGNIPKLKLKNNSYTVSKYTTYADSGDIYNYKYAQEYDIIYGVIKRNTDGVFKGVAITMSGTVYYNNEPSNAIWSYIYKICEYNGKCFAMYFNPSTQIIRTYLINNNNFGTLQIGQLSFNQISQLRDIDIYYNYNGWNGIMYISQGNNTIGEDSTKLYFRNCCYSIGGVITIRFIIASMIIEPEDYYFIDTFKNICMITSAMNKWVKIYTIEHSDKITPNIKLAINTINEPTCTYKNVNYKDYGTLNTDRFYVGTRINTTLDYCYVYEYNPYDDTWRRHSIQMESESGEIKSIFQYEYKGMHNYLWVYYLDGTEYKIKIYDYYNDEWNDFYFTDTDLTLDGILNATSAYSMLSIKRLFNPIFHRLHATNPQNNRYMFIHRLTSSVYDGGFVYPIMDLKIGIPIIFNNIDFSQSDDEIKRALIHHTYSDSADPNNIHDAIIFEWCNFANQTCVLFRNSLCSYVAYVKGYIKNCIAHDINNLISSYLYIVKGSYNYLIDNFSDDLMILEDNLIYNVYGNVVASCRNDIHQDLKNVLIQNTFVNIGILGYHCDIHKNIINKTFDTVLKNISYLFNDFTPFIINYYSYYNIISYYNNLYDTNKDYDIINELNNNTNDSQFKSYSEPYDFLINSGYTEETDIISPAVTINNVINAVTGNNIPAGTHTYGLSITSYTGYIHIDVTAGGSSVIYKVQESDNYAIWYDVLVFTSTADFDNNVNVLFTKPYGRIQIINTGLIVSLIVETIQRDRGCYAIIRELDTDFNTTHSIEIQDAYKLKNKQYLDTETVKSIEGKDIIIRKPKLNVELSFEYKSQSTYKTDNSIYNLWYLHHLSYNFKFYFPNLPNNSGLCDLDVKQVKEFTDLRLYLKSIGYSYNQTVSYIYDDTKSWSTNQWVGFMIHIGQSVNINNRIIANNGQYIILERDEGVDSGIAYEIEYFIGRLKDSSLELIKEIYDSPIFDDSIEKSQIPYSNITLSIVNVEDDLIYQL